MKSITVFPQLLMWLTLVNRSKEEPCGDVQELARARLKPSNEILIFSGPHFYLCDLNREEVKEKYLMEKYFRGAPLDMEGATLYNTHNSTSLIFTKAGKMYMYKYRDDAFSTSESVMDNMNDLENLEPFEFKVPGLKFTAHTGLAYCEQLTNENKKMSVCMSNSLYQCRAEYSHTNPLPKCGPPNEKIENVYQENCKGLTSAMLDDKLYMVLASNEDLLLFPMTDKGELDAKPSKSINLSKMFSCSNSTLLVIVLILAVGLVLLILMNMIVIGVLVARRRRKTKTVLVEKTVAETDITMDSKTKHLPQTIQTKRNNKEK